MGVTVSKFPDTHRPSCMGDSDMTTPTDLLDNSSPPSYNYDLIIIGGGSGGLAAAKSAVKYGKKVALCDFVKPSPAGSTWGLGGTCVNVGCIPKKLMHQAALLGQSIDDSSYFGWEANLEKNHDWSKMVNKIQAYIHSLNWNYKVNLHQDGVDYYNNFASFRDNHSLQLDDEKGGETSIITGENFIISVGGRPKGLEIDGGEFAISSDDLFSLEKSPGKVLLVGGSYVALECAGFLAGIGLDVTVLVRSILLRGFDQQMAEMVGDVLENHEVF
jgi:thioredoxin reductase (NADPH)